ncbi:hypothetical protein TNCV_309011 [Trichonephila clavipes]|nr:hypothetical protein TNCV_309011 [Trichonephila clavipes]
MESFSQYWASHSMEYFQKLVESVPCNVAAIIKARGGATRHKIHEKFSMPADLERGRDMALERVRYVGPGVAISVLINLKGWTELRVFD